MGKKSRGYLSKVSATLCGRDAEVRKCSVPWKIGVTGDELHHTEARAVRVKRCGGAEIEKGLDC